MKKDLINLVEIQSLQGHILSHKKLIAQEEERVVALKNEQENKLSEKHELETKQKIMEAELGKLEKSLFQLDKSLIQAKGHQLEIESEKAQMTLEHEIKAWEEDKERMETCSLELMEKIEGALAEMKAIETFSHGLQETLTEIKKETQQKIEIEQEKIKELYERIDNLLSLIGVPIKKIFLEVNKRYEFKGPLALVNKNRCNKCQMTLPSMTISIVESGTALELCPSCNRLLLPQSALH